MDGGDVCTTLNKIHTTGLYTQEWQKGHILYDVYFTEVE